jgi:hypothetical protein
MRWLICLFLIGTTMFTLFLPADNVCAQNTTETLVSDTVWAKGTQHQLSGDLIVPKGVTLTIEAGATVDFRFSKLQVQGTLIAKGTNESKITFKTTADRSLPLFPHGLPSPLRIEPSAQGWDARTQSGSIIEYAVISEKVYVEASIAISKSTLKSAVIASGSPILSDDNIQEELHIVGGQPTVTGCVLSSINAYAASPTVLNSTISGASVVNDDAVLSGNKFLDGIRLEGRITFKNNEVRLSYHNADNAAFRSLICIWGKGAVVSNNKLFGSNNSPPDEYFKETFVPPQIGIYIDSNSSSEIVENLIENCQMGISILPADTKIVRNSILNNYVGIRFSPTGGLSNPQQSSIYISDNNILVNKVGVQIYYFLSSPNITANSIYSNSLYNLQLNASNNIVVANNWWGTDNETAIAQTIYDHKNDERLGTVTFIPFMSDQFEADATPTPYDATQAVESATPAVPVYAIIGIVSLLAVASLTLVYIKKRKSKIT